MSLIMRTEVVYQVNYQDFNDFVNESYGFERIPLWEGSNQTEWPYNFQQVEESSNDVSHQFTTDYELNEYEIEALQDWITEGGTEGISAYIILRDLADKGLIPEGNYVINVSW